jgi:hypothetical protein
MKWESHFAATPMITAIGAEPNPGAYGPDAYRKSGHSFDPPDRCSTSIFTPHRRELYPQPRWSGWRRVPTPDWLCAFNRIQLDLIGQPAVGDKPTKKWFTRLKQ